MFDGVVVENNYSNNILKEGRINVKVPGINYDKKIEILNHSGLLLI